MTINNAAAATAARVVTPTSYNIYWRAMSQPVLSQSTPVRPGLNKHPSLGFSIALL